MLFSFVLGMVIHDEFETNLGTKIQTRENRRRHSIVQVVFR